MRVGMKVVALGTHPLGGYIKGHIYTVTGFNVCKQCGDLLYSIGVKWDPNCIGIICSWCGHKEYKKHPEHLYSHKAFAPVEEKGETYIEEYVEITPSKKGIEIVSRMEE